MRLPALILPALFLLSIPAPLLAKSKEKKPLCGEIQYPAKGNVNSQEGTFEAWIRLGMPPDKFNSGGKSARRMLVPFSILGRTPKKGKKSGPKEPGKLIFKFSDYKGKFGLRTVLDGDIVSKVAVRSSKFPWTDDKWYHIALTWKHEGSQYHLVVYVNGAECRSTDFKTSPFSISSSDYIRIGKIETNDDDTPADSGGIGSIDSFRISKTARTAAEIADAYKNGFKIDDKTLILEKFDKVKAKKSKLRRSNFAKGKHPETGATTPEKGPEGKLRGVHKLTDGRDGGKSMKFFILAP